MLQLRSWFRMYPQFRRNTLERFGRTLRYTFTFSERGSIPNQILSMHRQVHRDIESGQPYKVMFSAFLILQTEEETLLPITPSYVTNLFPIAFVVFDTASFWATQEEISKLCFYEKLAELSQLHFPSSNSIFFLCPYIEATVFLPWKLFQLVFIHTQKKLVCTTITPRYAIKLFKKVSFGKNHWAIRSCNHWSVAILPSEIMLFLLLQTYAKG